LTRLAGLIEQHRHARGFGWLDDLRRDVRHAWRGLIRSPLFAITAILTLAVGIGLNTIVFTVADTVLHKGFPLVARNDRLAYITSGVGCCVSVPDFDDWRAQARSFSSMSLVHGLPKTLAIDRGYPERVDVTEVTAGTFALVGQQPILGRDFAAADERPGAEPVAILRYGAWERRFGRDPAVVGRLVRLDGVPTTIVGVMPRGFSFPQNQDFWVPLVRVPDVLRRDNRDTWFVVGRLRDRVSHRDARAEMASIGRRLGVAHPSTNQGRNLVPYLEDFEGFFIGTRAATTYRVMIAAVALVLLIACANLANLVLARTLARSRELSVRMAIGAGRGRIVRQMMAESLMLAACGAAGGWLLARWGLRLYVLVATGSGISDQTLGTWFDDVLDYAMDYRVFSFLAAVSAMSALAFGLAPAVRASRLELTSVLSEGGRNGGSARTRRFAHALVAGEVALALLLLGGAAGMVNGLLAAMRPGTTFSPNGLVTAHIELPSRRYPDSDARESLHERLSERVSALATVERFAITSSLPTSAPGMGLRRPFERESAPIAHADERPTAIVQTVSQGYFSTLGLSLTAGRDFDARDRGDSPRVAIVSRRFAAQQWQGDAIGKRLRVMAGTAAGDWMTVVAVAPDIVVSREQAPEPVIYLPQRQAPSASVWLLALTRTMPESVSRELREVVRAVDADLPIVDGPVALSDRLARGYRYRAVIAGLFTIFAALALSLACLGLYAVVAQVVQARTREIGIRTVLGATRAEVLTLVLSDALRAVIAGAAVGLVAWLVLGQAIGSTVREWSPRAGDVVAAFVLLLLAAIVGCLLPARRALAVDPGDALRPE
jgi:putative ABC transport system permease protein